MGGEWGYRQPHGSFREAHRGKWTRRQGVQRLAATPIYKKRETTNAFLLSSSTRFGSLLRQPQELNIPTHSEHGSPVPLRPQALPLFLSFPF